MIYSAIAIFLIPIIQEVFMADRSVLLYISFALFTGLFITSLVFTIKLIFPIEVAYLTEPGKYYKDFRIQYELTETDRSKVDNALKASYIGELEKAVEVNDKVFKRKSSFYYNALIFALTSTIPFLLCLGYHIFQKDDKAQKIEIVKSKINCKLDKNKTMANQNTQAKPATSTSSTTTRTTQLPGMNNVQVIVSAPQLVKENSQYSSTDKKK